MKNLLSLLVLLAVTFTYAQDNVTPKFEKQGDKTEATYYYENGQVEQHGFFNKNNKLEGTWISYDNKGNKTAIGNYNNGVKVGQWFFLSGESLREVNYANNAVTSVSEWKNKKTVAIRE